MHVVSTHNEKALVGQVNVSTAPATDHQRRREFFIKSFTLTLFMSSSTAWAKSSLGILGACTPPGGLLLSGVVSEVTDEWDFCEED